MSLWCLSGFLAFPQPRGLQPSAAPSCDLYRGGHLTGRVYSSKSRRYEVVLGEYDMSQQEASEQRIPVNPEDIFVHPRWISLFPAFG